MVSVLVASACSSSKQVEHSARFSSDSGAPLAATAPHLLMNDSMTGLAVWPSGEAWVLLRTSDGWRHVANRTPIAVPTGGGLVPATSAADIAVAVGAFERLTQSPLVTSTGAAGPWLPSELPGAVSDSRAAVSISGRRSAAVLTGADGTVVSRTGDQWTRLTDAAALAPGGGLRLDGVTWAGDTLGWLTGHGRSGLPMAFQTTDGGRSWAPIRAATGTAVAALAPCGQGTSWLLPVIAGNDTVRVYRTTDGAKSWRPGASVPLAADPPAWGCHGSDVWIAGRAGHNDHVFASKDAGESWADAGAAPTGLTDLSPTGNDAGFAASTTGHRSTLWAVTRNGAGFRKLTLPGWVATVGAQMGTS